ncbi:MAG: hypothetical protein GY847_17905 [Proteobacteria bacterium]|nr:hypothetical protein [Pseudomonadota bacterium]
MEIEDRDLLGRKKLLLGVLLITQSVVACGAQKSNSVVNGDDKYTEQYENNSCEEQFRLFEDSCWRICPLGQEWNGEICKNEPNLSITLNEAKRLCSEIAMDCRVPNNGEIVSLFEECEVNVLNDGTGKCRTCNDSEKCATVYESRLKDIGVWAIDTSKRLGNASWVVFFDGTVTARISNAHIEDPIGAVCVCNPK